jgi:hypothetical protein
VLQPHHLVSLLKSVKHLSMNVALLDVLQQANAIDILVRILKVQDQSAHATVRRLTAHEERVLNKPSFPRSHQITYSKHATTFVD